MTILTLMGAGLAYIFIGVGVFFFLTVYLKWNDTDETFMCSMGWPIFIAFWLVIGAPIAATVWFFRAAGRLLNKVTNRKDMGEVK